MISDVHITLEGEPMNIQRIADLFERAFPGVIQWNGVAEPSASGVILKGIGIPANFDLP